MFRTAAIESKIAVPTEEEDSRIYDIKYYSRDTRRSKEHSQIKVITHPSIMITDGDAAPLAIGSPGTFAVKFQFSYYLVVCLIELD